MKEKEITTERLVLVDGQGKRRGMLDVTQEGIARLCLFDETDRIRFVAGVEEARIVHVALADERSIERLNFSNAAIDTGLYFNDANGVSRVAFGIHGSEVRLVLSDDQNRVRGTLGLKSNGDGDFRIVDSNGKILARLP